MASSQSADARATEARGAGAAPAATIASPGTASAVQASATGAPIKGANGTVFAGAFTPVGADGGYKLAVAATAIAVLLIPLVYIAVLLGLAFLAYWDVTSLLAMFRKGGGLTLWKAGLLIAALPVLGLLLLFLAGPLWPSRGELASDEPVEVRANDQPELHGLVNDLCDHMGAPRPERIFVDTSINAAAIRRGFLLGVFSSRYDLLLGLPLLGAMTKQELVFVIAHEIGHFRQDWATRVGGLMLWLRFKADQLVFAPTRADLVALQAGRASSETTALLGLYLLLGTRLVLYVGRFFMSLVSSWLERRGEFDADLNAARIVGAAAAQGAQRRIMALSKVEESSAAIINRLIRRGRLPDDLPMITAVSAQRCTPDQVDKLVAASLDAQTGWHDTHPDFQSRLEAMAKDNAPGVLRLSGQAADLMGGFDGLCQRCTTDLYMEVLDEDFGKVEIVSSRTVLEQEYGTADTGSGLAKLLGPEVVQIQTLLPLLPRLAETAFDLPEHIKALGAARLRVRELRGTHGPAIRQLLDADMRLDALVRARAALFTKAKINHRALGLEALTGPEVDRVVAATQTTFDDAASRLDVFYDAVSRRLNLATAVLSHKQVAAAYPAAKTLKARLAPIKPVLEVLRAAQPALGEIRRLEVELTGELATYRPSDRQNQLLTNRFKRGAVLGGELWHALRDVKHPFEQEHLNHSIAEVVISDFPPEDYIVDRYVIGLELANACSVIHRRTLHELADIAMTIESDLPQILK